MFYEDGYIVSETSEGKFALLSHPICSFDNYHWLLQYGKTALINKRQGNSMPMILSLSLYIYTYVCVL